MQKTGFLKEDEHRANLPRHAHDLSQSFGYTASTGMLLPVYQDFLNAGDSDYFSGNLLARAQPFVTQAMIDVDFYLDWFFVPMTMILNTWQNVRWMTRDFISSSYDLTSRAFFDGGFPVLDIAYLANSKFGTEVWSPNESVSLDTSFSYPAYYFDCSGKSTFRLLNHLGFNPYVAFDGDPDYDTNNLPSRTTPNVWPCFARAYQAIFFDYFRVDDYTPRLVGYFNDDNFYTRSLSAPVQSTSNPFILHYRPYKDDYFTGVQSSPMTSSVNLLGAFSSSSLGTNTPAYVLSRLDNYLGKDLPISNQPATSGYANDDFRYESGSGDSGRDFTNVINTGSTTAQYNVTRNLSTANIRQMFAVEKLMRITGKAAKNYDAQMLAHFGIKIPHDVKHDLTHIGTDKALMHIGQVVSTSDTFDGSNGSALGSLSGQGYVVIKGKRKKFTAPVDGIIMCIASAVPSKYYYGGFDKLNAVTNRLDYYIPEYDRLGKQPLFSYETEQKFIGTSQRVGWQWRYQQYKRKYNRVSEAFRQPRNNTSVNQYMPWINASRPYDGVGDNQGATWSELPAYKFYCTPHELDNCMVVPYMSTWSSAYSTTPWLMFATDPFICHFHADVKKVSVMSPTGEPPLD